MEEERCFRCYAGESEARIFDAVSQGEIVKICTECNRIENLPVIKKPSTGQLKESEKAYTVEERLRRMSGMGKRDRISELSKRITTLTLDDLRKRKTELHGGAVKENAKPFILIDNYNWHAMMARKKKKLARKQLAEAIGESETAIKMFEDKNLPEDAEILIKKIEQFFGIKLRKENNRGEERARESVRERLEQIGKENRKALENRACEQKPYAEKESDSLKFDSKAVKNLTIDDLRKMKQEREKLAERKLNAENSSMQEKPKLPDISKLIWQVEKEDRAKRRVDDIKPEIPADDDKECV